MRSMTEQREAELAEAIQRENGRYLMFDTSVIPRWKQVFDKVQPMLWPQEESEVMKACQEFCGDE